MLPLAYIVDFFLKKDQGTLVFSGKLGVAYLGDVFYAARVAEFPFSLGGFSGTLQSAFTDHYINFGG